MARFERIKRFVRDNLLSGILVVVPLVVSVYVLVKLSVWLYNTIVFLPINYERIEQALSSVFPSFFAQWIMNSIHILEFITAIVVLLFLTALVGLFTKNRAGKWTVSVGERIVDRIPLMGMVYSSLKQLLQAIFSGRGNFSRVVLIEYPRRGIWSLGFLSRESDKSVETKTGEKMWSVFVPTTPNPTSGYLLMIPEEDVHAVDLTIEQAFKIIISAGMVLAHEEPGDVLESGSFMEKLSSGPESKGDNEE